MNEEIEGYNPEGFRRKRGGVREERGERGGSGRGEGGGVSRLTGEDQCGGEKVKNEGKCWAKSRGCLSLPGNLSWVPAEVAQKTLCIVT